MKRFRHLIGRHEDEFGKLHAMVWETFHHRDKSELALREWQLAAKRFRDYRSEVDELVGRCIAEGISDDNELRMFAFCFVECDPYYHRSGYTLEALLRKMKMLNLSDAEKLLLQNLILRRIDTKALRNFRQICRFIPTIETPGFSNEVASRSRSGDPSIRHRAELAISYFPSNS